MGVDTPEVSATIFQQWKFEERLIDVIAHCESPQEAQNEETQRAAAILDTVRVAVPINGVVTPESIEEAKKLVEKYQLNMETFENAIESFV